MNIDKLWFLIDKLEPEYFNLMNEVSSCFLQEMIDSESFNNEGARQVGSSSTGNGIRLSFYPSLITKS